MSLAAILAGKLVGPLTSALTPHVKKLVLGPPEQRSAEKVIRAAAQDVAKSLPSDPGLSLYAVRWLSMGEIAQLLVDSAFPGGPTLDRGDLLRRLADLGYDHDTSEIDLPGQALVLGGLIADGLRDEVDKPGSPLFQRFVTAHLEDISAQLRVAGVGQVHGVDLLLPALPQPFVGRDADLAVLRAWLDPDAEKRQGLIVIRGWPGVGKSSMAAAVVHDPTVSGWFPDGVLWAALSETPEVSAQLDIWLRRLHLGAATRDESIATKAQLLAGRLRRARMLLIVDDVWQAADAQPFLAYGPGCAALVTTRLTEVARSLGTGEYVLPILTDDVAFELVTTLAGNAVSGHREEVIALVHELEGLPLALRVAAKLLAAEHRYGWGIDQLLADLREGSRLLAVQAPPDQADLAKATIPTVAALLARSTDRLAPDIRTRFARLGVFASRPATFDLAAIAAQWEMPDPRPSVKVLVDRGLLEPDGRGRFQLHALLSLHARSIMRGY